MNKRVLASGDYRAISIGQQMEPGVKSWVDNVFVPALLIEYARLVEMTSDMMHPTTVSEVVQ